MLVMALIMFPCVATGVFGANAILTWWLGTQFADMATLPMQIMCVGVLFNSLAQFPFSLIQAVGRVKLIAYIHCLELPLYFVLLSALLTNYGIDGAAWAWLIRVFVDFAVLIFVARRISRGFGFSTVKS